MMIRIISGERRGTKLQTPEGLDTRPLRGRVREALFNILRPVLPGMRVLDAFAGSGAAGLEALSNGASWATFAESAPGALGALEANVGKVRYSAESEVLRGPSPGILGRTRVPGGRWDLLLLMPPYHSGLCGTVLASEEVRSRTEDGAIAVCEVHRDEEFAPPEGWEQSDYRLYGVTRLVFLELRGKSGEG